VDLEPLDREDLAFVHDLIARHAVLTGSRLAARLLDAWSATSLQFTKVMPRDYKRAMLAAAISPQGSDRCELAGVPLGSDPWSIARVAHG